MTTPITFWNGSTPLTAQQHADNILGLFELIQSAFETAGAVGVAGIGTTTFEGSPAFFLTLSNGVQTVPVKLPAAVANFRGSRITGTAYTARDLITAIGDNGTVCTYWVLTDHVASAALSTDLAAGRLQLMVEGGRNAETFKGNWNAAVAYPTSSVVLKDSVFWKATVDIPAGGAAPGAGGPSWGIALYQSVPAANVFVTAETKTLATVIAELRAEIADLKGRVETLEAA